MTASHTIVRILFTLLLVALLLGGQTLPLSQTQTQKKTPVAPGTLAPKKEEPKQEQREAVIRTTVHYVLAPTIVTDKQGNFVSGLNPSDFQLFDNGKPQAITEDMTYHPISLVVAVQANWDMQDVLPKVQKIGSVLDSLVIGENGEVAVIAFDHRVQTLLDFTSETGKLEEAFKKLKAGSSSSRLNDAAMDAIRMLNHRPTTRRRVILLIGETRDNGSELHTREVMNQAEFNNVVIYSVDIAHLIAKLTSTPQPPRPNPIPPAAQHMPDGSLATPTMQSQMQTGNWIPAFVEIFKAAKGVFIPNPMEVFTRYTGGRQYSFASQSTLERAVADIGSELHNEYLLSYSPNNQDEGGFHEITVVVRRPDLKVRTRNGYWLAGKGE